ncbi:hypothetical protein AVEN_244748-1 [Araneus ventricosus]|uniref:Uncharacterized protein n=1 Tax=Araneus ventricosus TaxID=182803 RepID=A0A4Y2BTI3_ARAVE|nr:hypothetical protein AVEN_244748-1 [Araneus ventricosus]
MKILDNTIHVLKISNSQNLEDFKFAESDITSPYQKLVGESNSFVLQFQQKKNNIKITSFLKAQRPPEAPNALGPQLQLLQPHVQPITKEIQIITENDSSDRRQNLITPNSCAKTRWRRNNPVAKF